MIYKDEMEIGKVRRRRRRPAASNSTMSREQQSSELRIVLVGKVGAGKTSVVNTFLRSSEEKKNPVPADPCETEECEETEIRIGGRTMVVVDTPGLCSSEKTDEEVMDEIRCCGAPHVLLLVLSCLDRFTAEEEEMVKIVKDTFGGNVTEHTVVVFTFGDHLKKQGRRIQDFIEDSARLSSFVDECDRRCHVIDNTDLESSQVSELLQMVDAVVQENGGELHAAKKTQEAATEGGGGVRRKIALSVNGSAVAGAGLGGAVSHLSGSSLGIVAGVAVGAAVGGVIGGVGIVVAERIKAKKCTVQ